ncbi:MAG: FAD-dependent oxidoreductase [Verrucomicrobiales bacterium]|nr:FAD-dependent oxidoreductase [Verrucomicrobiales bacterium]
MKVDYLIVGQGLAGSLLAWQLLRRNKRILVVDRDETVTSSKIAAGLVTPITGSKFSISPAFEERLNFARQFYRDLELATGTPFFHEQRIAKLLRNVKEKDNWEAIDRSEESSDHPYRGPLDLDPSLLHAENGGFEMKGGGWLDVPAFLETTRQHLLERASYAIGKVNSAEVHPHSTGVQWKNINAKQIIFAEGWRNHENQFFDWIRMHSALGDILDVRIPGLDGLELIINKGAWLLPVGGDRFRTGSNYRHQLASLDPDHAGREEIIEKLRSITPLPFEVIDHRCAVRPIIHRSQIFAGIHPAHDSVAFFNGLGSKGVVNGPWYAERFTQLLEDGIPLPPESDIQSNLV